MVPGSQSRHRRSCTESEAVPRRRHSPTCMMMVSTFKNSTTVSDSSGSVACSVITSCLSSHVVLTVTQPHSDEPFRFSSQNLKPSQDLELHTAGYVWTSQALVKLVQCAASTGCKQDCTHSCTPREPSKRLSPKDWDGSIYYLAKENPHGSPGVKCTSRHVWGMRINVAAEKSATV